MRLIFRVGFFLFLLIGGILLGNENSLEVELTFFGSTIEAIPLWLVMLLSFAVGAAATLVLCTVEIIRAWKRVYNMKKRLKEAGLSLESDSEMAGEVLQNSLNGSNTTELPTPDSSVSSNPSEKNEQKSTKNPDININQEAPVTK